ncbi:hypothetical protein JW707_03945 [Candidatus Woesearchaeota archaeon]|nr:hypothetical protein [Candidatus Woesearchaeota archaeon]
MEIYLNLLKNEGWEDGLLRYIGMYNTKVDGALKGGPELIYSDPKDLFEELRKHEGTDITVKITSQELPSELREMAWFSGRSPIEKSELLQIVEEQKKAGHDIELID